jgi:hypothetical protein
VLVVQEDLQTLDIVCPVIEWNLGDRRSPLQRIDLNKVEIEGRKGWKKPAWFFLPPSADVISPLEGWLRHLLGRNDRMIGLACVVRGVSRFLVPTQVRGNEWKIFYSNVLHLGPQDGRPPVAPTGDYLGDAGSWGQRGLVKTRKVFLITRRRCDFSARRVAAPPSRSK